MTSLVPQMTFGLNKSIPTPNADRNKTYKILGEILRIYDLHTNNSVALNDLGGWFEGSNSPFKTPDVVICTTARVIEMLMNEGVCKQTTVDMKQIMTVVSLDMHPMHTVVLQMSVSFKNGTYVCDPDEQMIKKTHKTPDHKIYYAQINTQNVVFVPVDDG